MEEGTSSNHNIINSNKNKVLVFKSNNEENNAKAAALKSLIKLSSGSNLLQNKQQPVITTNKEHPLSASSTSKFQIKQNPQNMNLMNQQNQNVVKPTSANTYNKSAQQQQYIQKISSTSTRPANNQNYHPHLKQLNPKDSDRQIHNPQNEPAIQQNKDLIVQVVNQVADKENSTSQKPSSANSIPNMKNLRINTQAKEVPIASDYNTPSSVKNLNQAQQSQKLQQFLFSQTQKLPQRNQIKTKQPVSRNQQITSQNSQSQQSNQSIQQCKQPNALLIQQNQSFLQEQIQKSETQKLSQFSRKNSTLSNGSNCQGTFVKQSPVVIKKDKIDSNFATTQSKCKGANQQSNFNTSQLTYNTQPLYETLQKSARDNQRPDIQDFHSKFLSDLQSNVELTNVKKDIEYYDAVSPQTCPDFKQTEIYGNISQYSQNYFDDDESIVIIQEDQLRMPTQAQSLSRKNSSLKNLLQKPPIPQIEKTENSMTSVFIKRHDNSVADQESLVTEVKSQLMKLHFQQTVQNIDPKQKQRNKVLDVQSSQSFQFQPQFDDFSFEMDTLNQVRVPRNLQNPISQAQIIQLPFEQDLYKETQDPKSGRICWKVENQAITIIKPKLKKNIAVKVENTIKIQELSQIKDPLEGKLKQDYKSKQEEENEEKIIQNEIEISMNQSIQDNNNNNSFSMRQSDLTISNDISLNSNIFANQGNSVQGIINYAAEKLNIREGDPLFLMPRLNDPTQSLKPALLKREPDWWIGSELSTFGYSKLEGEPILETFLF